MDETEDVPLVGSRTALRFLGPSPGPSTRTPSDQKECTENGTVNEPERGRGMGPTDLIVPRRGAVAFRRRPRGDLVHCESGKIAGDSPSGREREEKTWGELFVRCRIGEMGGVPRASRAWKRTLEISSVFVSDMVLLNVMATTIAPGRWRYGDLDVSE